MPSLFVLTLLTLAGVAPAAAQQPSASWPEQVRRLREVSTSRPATGKTRLSRMSARRDAALRFEAIIAESEPNDSVRTADSVALGDRATGAVNSAHDVDTWFVDLAAGQFFSVDVDAESIGSPLDGAVVELRVSAGAAATDYTAQVIEVADRQNTLRASLAGYALTAGR